MGVYSDRLKKRGLRHGSGSKRGVLGTGQARKMGGLRHGSGSKKGCLRHESGKKGGGVFTAAYGLVGVAYYGTESHRSENV